MHIVVGRLSTIIAALSNELCSNTISCFICLTSKEMRAKDQHGEENKCEPTHTMNFQSVGLQVNDTFNETQALVQYAIACAQFVAHRQMQVSC